MSDQLELQRVREDLATVREAVRLEVPVDWSDVWGCLLLALCGLLAGALGFFLPAEYRRIAVLGFVPLGLFFVAQTMQRRHKKARRPALWREMRYTWIVLLVFVPLVYGYMRWEQQMGLPREWVGASAVFFVGAVLLLFSIIDRTRRHYGISAVGLLVFGLSIPFSTPQQVILTGCGCCIAIGLATALLEAWWLASHDRKTATD